MSAVVETSVAMLLIVGALFMLLGAVGLVRFPDLLTRLHGPSKASTLGLGALLLASIVAFTALEQSLSVHELLITLFVAITTPVSAQFVARAARRDASASSPDHE
jgi:multicomponent K+:H+ antiporter subunit G